MTIVQLASGASDKTFILGTQIIPGTLGQISATNAEISDLTCDGNYTSGSYTYCGVSLVGTENAVRRVKVINLAKFGGSSESFGIALGNESLSDSEGNIIEECEVSHFAGGTGGISAICLNGATPGYGISGIIRNNRVFLPFEPMSGFAFNGSWMHDSLIEGNYVNGADDAFYGDTGGSTNVIIAHNIFRNVGHGVSLNGQVRNNITIAFNSISLTNPPGYNLIYAFGTWTPSNSIFTNITIIGNNVENHGVCPYMDALYIYNATGIIFIDNKIDPSLTNFLGNCTGVNIDNNYDLIGNYRSDMNMPTLGGVHATSFGLSFLGSISQSTALTALGLPSNPLMVVTNDSTLPVTFNTNVTVYGALNYSNMVAQLIAGTGLTISAANTSTGRVVTVNANSQTNGFGSIVTHSTSEFTSTTNATIWNSLSVTNTAATNWATLSVTPSNAVISVRGINVAILQTNGVLNAYNGLSTTISNTLPPSVVTMNFTTNPYRWTNTTPDNLVTYVYYTNKCRVGYNSITNYITGTGFVTNGCITVMLKPGSYLCVSNNTSTGSATMYWHPF